MSCLPAFITGIGAVSPAGADAAALRRALEANRSHLAPLTAFEPGAGGPRPAGQVAAADLVAEPGDWPRTHRMALQAAREALAGAPAPPEAVVLGGTTGGMPSSEPLLMAGERDPARYRWHGTGTVAEAVAAAVGCRGPALTVSTACSSSAVALKLALELLRSGRFSRVLAGGADGLCRLTYHGFALLQLVDPDGARPLDAERAGLSVSEAAAMLLLESGAAPPPGCLGLLLGGGLSCDAHHATAPHPQGRGAANAMRAALADAGIAPAAVDYISLHGTGTPDNDAAEARALHTVFGERLPPLSSSKGAVGHSLAAAGALEAVGAVVAMAAGMIPANTGLERVDPALELAPVREPRPGRMECVLSNSFGFGGNNAALVLGRADSPVAAGSGPAGPEGGAGWLRVRAAEALSGAGWLEQTWQRLAAGASAAGRFDERALVADLEPRAVRRSKRLPRMALALGQRVAGAPDTGAVEQIHFGTGWGPLGETHAFLDRLFASAQRLSSPTDFVGSVHNAPAGRLAIRHRARGPSATATGGDVSFEQALWMTGLLLGERPGLLLAADEHHPGLGPLFEPAAAGAAAADGGGAFLLDRGEDGVRLRCAFLGREPSAAELLAALGGAERVGRRFGAVMLGLPAAQAGAGRALYQQLAAALAVRLPVIELRPLLGEYATVSACAAALAVRAIECDRWLDARPLNGRGVLLLNLGRMAAAVEVLG